MKIQIAYEGPVSSMTIPFNQLGLILHELHYYQNSDKVMIHNLDISTSKKSFISSFRAALYKTQNSNLINIVTCKESL